jgi:hypothetical protein
VLLRSAARHVSERCPLDAANRRAGPRRPRLLRLRAHKLEQGIEPEMRTVQADGASVSYVNAGFAPAYWGGFGFGPGLFTGFLLGNALAPPIFGSYYSGDGDYGSGQDGGDFGGGDFGGGDFGGGDFGGGDFGGGDFGGGDFGGGDF